MMSPHCRRKTKYFSFFELCPSIPSSTPNKRSVITRPGSVLLTSLAEVCRPTERIMTGKRVCTISAFRVRWDIIRENSREAFRLWSMFGWGSFRSVESIKRDKRQLYLPSCDWFKFGFILLPFVRNGISPRAYSLKCTYTQKFFFA